MLKVERKGWKTWKLGKKQIEGPWGVSYIKWKGHFSTEMERKDGSMSMNWKGSMNE